MPTYQYTARDERGQAKRGTLLAESPAAVADQLQQQGYVITGCRETSRAARGASVNAGTRVDADALMLMTVQLAKMVQVGIPLNTALDTVAKQTDAPRLRALIEALAQQIESGAGFSESLGRFPRVFPPLYISMVRAGEASGKLDEALRRLSLLMKRQAELRQQLVTAMTYPLLLLAVGIGAVVFLLVSIIPKFMTIFVDAGVPLPLPTLLLAQTGEALRRYGLVLGVALAGLLWLAQASRGTARGRRYWDGWALRIPVVGEVIRRTALARLARTLETLFSSGVPILESLTIAEATCGNVVIGDVCSAARAKVQQGQPLAEAFKQHAEVPPIMAQMLAIGEASGALEHLLGEIAAYYEELVQHGIKRLTSLIEPAFLLVMGGLIAFILASVLLPLFKMVSVVK